MLSLLDRPGIRNLLLHDVCARAEWLTYLAKTCSRVMCSCVVVGRSVVRLASEGGVVGKRKGIEIETSLWLLQADVFRGCCLCLKYLLV